MLLAFRNVHVIKLFSGYWKTLVFVIIYPVYSSWSIMRHLVAIGGIKLPLSGHLPLKAIFRWQADWPLKASSTRITLTASIWHLLAQGIVPHSILSSSAPVQLSPLYWGRGCVHDLNLTWYPPSQVTEHLPQPPHSDHPPSTVHIEISCLSWYVLTIGSIFFFFFFVVIGSLKIEPSHLSLVQIVNQ